MWHWNRKWLFSGLSWFLNCLWWYTPLVSGWMHVHHWRSITHRIQKRQLLVVFIMPPGNSLCIKLKNIKPLTLSLRLTCGRKFSSPLFPSACSWGNCLVSVNNKMWYRPALQVKIHKKTYIVICQYISKIDLSWLDSLIGFGNYLILLFLLYWIVCQSDDIKK